MSGMAAPSPVEAGQEGTFDLRAWTSSPSFDELFQYPGELAPIPLLGKSVETRRVPALIMFDLSKYYSNIWQIEAKHSGQSPIYVEILCFSLIGSLECLHWHTVCP